MRIKRDNEFDFYVISNILQDSVSSQRLEYN